MSRRAVTVIAVLGTSAALLCGCSGGGGTADASEGSAAATAAAETAGQPIVEDEAVPSPQNGAGEAALVDRPTGLLLTGPRVIQNATLALSVPRGRFEETVDEARTLVAGLGGFVTSSSASQGDGQRLVRGTLVVRVPGQAYSRAMSALAKLGRVESREESGEDVSAQFVDLEARKRHLEAVESQLLEFLRRTQSVREALAVQSRLDDVQLGLEQVRGQLRYLDDQTALATVTLRVAERGVPVVTPSDDGFGIADAWSAAVKGLEKVAGGILVAIVTAGPILLGLAFIALGARMLIRRRRARDGAGASAPTATPQP